eukprot:Seg685.4 transcript_id=Seg685.4/GoldUCD/mRNA.D3Y31 product="putative skeletal organic matrix protein 5" protein_id=Seg685.4/GoldUCD/D3Y31
MGVNKQLGSIYSSVKSLVMYIVITTGRRESNKFVTNMFEARKLLTVLLLFIKVGASTILRLPCKYHADFSIVLDGLGDSGAALKQYPSKTKRECVLECISLPPCQAVNHKQNGGNCELIGRNLTESKDLLTSRTGWTYLTTNDNELNIGPKCKSLAPCQNGGKCVDTCSSMGFQCICINGYTGTFCEKERGKEGEFTSCQDAYNKGIRTDGVYQLTNMGYHYCALNDTLGCTENGGYTLAMRVNGALNTFHFDANYWTTNNVYNDLTALRQDFFDGEQAKFDAYNKMPFTRVCIGMKVGNAKNFGILLSHASTSLLAYIGSGTAQRTSQGRARWLALVAGGSIQGNCNREGFNTVADSGSQVKVRIGILGNNERDCNTPDSALGIGLILDPPFRIWTECWNGGSRKGNGASTILRLSCKYHADFSIVLDGLGDSGAALKQYPSKTRRECVLECISLPPCQAVNHKQNGGNCELIGRNLTESKNLLTSRTGWTYLTTNDNELNIGPKCQSLAPCQNGGKCVDTCSSIGFQCICINGYTGTFCEKEREFTSCQDAYNKGIRTDGVYLLTNMGYHYCALSDTLGCTENGGYTLAMRVNGALTTFRFDANYWTTSNVYNDVFALRQDFFDGEQAKFDAYNKMPFTRACIGMKVGNAKNFGILLTHASTSLLAYIGSGTGRSTYRGRAKWLALVAGGSIQGNCNREGFNRVADSGFPAKVRIGILGNNEGGCSSPDSALGIGIGGNHLSGKSAGATNKAAIAYLLIK